MDFAESASRDSPLRAAARFWPVSAFFIALGLFAGTAAASRHAPTYTAEARLAVGGQDLPSQAIPGFAQASQIIAADFARYVSMPQQEAALKAALGAKASDVTGLSASPIPSSNIISVEATSHVPDTAVAAAQATLTALMAAVNSPEPSTTLATLLAQYQAMSTKAAQAGVELQSAKEHLTTLTADRHATDTDLAAARAAVVETQSRFDGLALQQSALGNRYQQMATSTTPSSNLTIVQQAGVVFDNKRSNQEKFALGGAAVGVVAALAVATLLGRLRPPRPRRRSHPNHEAARRTRGAGTDDAAAPMPPGERVGESGHP